MENANTEKLKLVLEKYGVPDPKIVGKLPKGGIQLDYVSHAEITKILLEIDPHWRWVPIEWKDGRPAVHVENGIATMWGELTLLGQARLGVGSVRADRADLDKELVGDFLRNAAMRFGIALSLWSKQEWEENEQPRPAARPKPAAQRLAARAAEPATPQVLTDEQRAQFVTACEKAQLDPATVARNAGLDWDKGLTENDLPALRNAFKELKDFKEGA